MIQTYFSEAFRHCGKNRLAAFAITIILIIGCSWFLYLILNAPEPQNEDRFKFKICVGGLVHICYLVDSYEIKDHFVIYLVDGKKVMTPLQNIYSIQDNVTTEL